MSLLERVQAAGVLEEEPLGGQDRKRREQLRKALVDRLGLSAVARLVTEERPERAREELKVACEAVLNGQDFGITEGEERAGLVQEVLDDILGLGVLQPLMDDPSITEIMVNGTRSLYFERDGQIHGARRVFETADQIMLVIDRILAPLGRRLDESSPIVNARLPNGDRVNAVMAPIAIDYQAL